MSLPVRVVAPGIGSLLGHHNVASLPFLPCISFWSIVQGPKAMPIIKFGANSLAYFDMLCGSLFVKSFCYTFEKP